MSDIEPVSPDQRLRIAVLADFEGPHARSWLRWFIARGHEVHAVSFYPPRVAVEGAAMHALRTRRHPAGEHDSPGVSSPVEPVTRSPRGTSARQALRQVSERLPRGALRLAHGARYLMAGLGARLQHIDPDILHAHYVVEHGFYGALARRHPLVVTAWGSDVLVEPRRDPVSKMIARWTVQHADLVTSNNAHMARSIGALGTVPAKVAVVTLGAERYDLELAGASVNVRPPDQDRPPRIVSTRAHEPLYNIRDIIAAHAIVARERPEAELVVAHGGSQTEELRSYASTVTGRADFVGYLARADFRDALSRADVFVSVPSSDATSVALLQAMAGGAFPIVADLPSQHEWIRDGVNGFLVPVNDPERLAAAISRALAAPELRRSAAELNRRVVEDRGLNDTQMAKMEELYRALVR